MTDDTWGILLGKQYRMPYRKRKTIVTPFDVKNPVLKGLGMSHGFVHFVTERGEVNFCGCSWFLENAELLHYQILK